MESSVSVRCKKCGDTIALGTTIVNSSECIANFETQRITCPHCHENCSYDRDDLVLATLPEGGSCYGLE
jgi:hypothetical protein